ncbi:TonB-dependent receptor [Pseudoxanthomonas sp.]|uniref:TonB-dependent receptor n=1 Tax=Pseudoxanthomonas sp. TaxID=1871049 RepID=UPI002638F746|nr:TonB-dependent receptor [Pseudoxanthomonas sp.]WDS37721.1 MAG: TonB-dependent receptor [Pseudoxanthomonas sp.]
MSHRHTSRPLRRTALALVLGAALAHGSAFAQSTSGDITGTAPVAQGETIQVTSISSGVTRQVTVDASGRFRAASLPTGAYTLTLTNASGEKSTRNVTVIAGQTSTASFGDADATSLDRVVVTGTNLNAIDLSSVESRTTFTADQLNSLPVGRDITSVSLLTPGTVAASGYFGPASFGGASAAENSYYVSGFNITNLYDSLSFSEVPFQAIDQLDVQTGGYGAQYGFSTGGVTSVNVKHGTNEWKGGVSWTGAPDSLRENIPDTTRGDGQTARSYENNYSSSNVTTAWIGGPLIKDKLFIYALGQFSQSNSTSYAARSGTSKTSVSTTAQDYESKTPYWLVKLDWYLNDWNHFEYTGFDNSRRYTYDYYNGAYDGVAAGSEAHKTKYLGQLVGKSGGQTDVFKWTSNLTDNLTASLQYGQMRNQSSEFLVSPDGTQSYYSGDINGPIGDCPVVYSYDVGGYLGCAVSQSSINMKGGSNERKATRLDFDWQLGDHKVGFGYSDERWKSKAGSAYSSGGYYTYDTDDDGVPYVDLYTYRTGGKVEIDQKSWYIDDHWQITDNFMLYGGIRNDSFDNKNTDGVSFVKQDNIWQPRLGFAWDILGNGRDKLYGSLGRYSLPIAANVALRAASASYYTDTFYTYDSIDPVSGKPINPVSYLNGSADTISNGENGTTPDPKAVASSGLKPYTQDEAILGYQHQFSSDIAFLDNWTVGIKGTYRRINNVIDDTCDARAVYNAATAQGLTLSNWDSEWEVPGNLPGCYLYNPGEDLNITMDVDGNGTLDNIHVDGSDLGPKAKRYYKAMTLSADKATDKWYVSASYTWAKLNGNYEGLVKSTNGQDDTGTTSDFDFKEIMYGADGYLFNDHRHSFKLYGGYKFTDQWSVGANLLVQSGAPISCLGGGYGSFGTKYGYSGVFHTCNAGTDDIANLGSAGRTPWTATFSPNLNYTPSWLPGLSAQLSIINAFNSVKPLQVYETKYTQNSAGTVTNYYNYKVGKYFTDPRYVRLQVQYDF